MRTLLCAALCMASPLGAQTSVRAESKHVDSMRAELLPAPPPDWRGESVSADTGRMIAGHLDFRRYDPEMCLWGVRHVQAFLYRHNEGDTLRYTPAGDTLATVAVDTGKTCSARFHDVSVPPKQLGALIQLYLAVGDDARARAAADRWLAMDLSPGERYLALLTITRAYIWAKPIRMQDVERMLAIVDSGTTIGAKSTLQTRLHWELVSYWTQQFNATEIRKHGEAAFAIAERAPAEERPEVEMYLLMLYPGVRSAIEYEDGKDSVQAFIARVRAFLTPGQGRAREFFNGWFAPYDEERYLPLLGTRLPPIAAKWSIDNRAGNPSIVQVATSSGTQGNPALPHAGRVRLIIPLARDDGRYFGTYAMLRRFAARYGLRGLDIILVKQTLGYSPGSLVQTPEEELQSMETVYLEFQKIPATILVEETAFVTLPDGRRKAPFTPFLEFSSSEGAWLVDERGVIRWGTKLLFGLSREAEADAQIQALLSERKVVKGSE